MRVFQIGKSRLWLVALAGVLATFLLAAVVAGQASDAASSEQDRIEVVSPAGVATFEGELGEPR